MKIKLLNRQLDFSGM